jgi:hypothetical protein
MVFSINIILQGVVYLLTTLINQDLVALQTPEITKPRPARSRHVTIYTRLSKARTKKYVHATRAAQKNDRDPGSGRVYSVMLTSVIDASRNVHLDLNL